MRRGVFAACVALLLAPAAAQEPQDMPRIILDESAADWLVDRFAGNSTAGPQFLQGPAREAGGLGRCGACPLPDGSVVIPFHGGLAEVDAQGTLRLLLEDSDVLQSTTAQVCAHAGVAYNPRDKGLYVAGRNCLRRLVRSPDVPAGTEPFAGVPGKPGYGDGPAATATFTRLDSIVIDSRGTFYILDNNERIRRIKDGEVTTLNARVRSGKRTDGPLAEATFALTGLGGNLCAGENDETLYLSDHWNFVVRRIDLARGEVTTVAGMPKPESGKAAEQTPREKRYNANCDGPALTWASFNSGCAYVCYDPFHQALWCGGPDENRFRWLKGGWLRTVIGAKPDRYKWPKDAIGVPAEVVFLCWNAVVATDARGGVYLSCSGEPNGLWRAYNVKEAKP